MKDKTIVYYCIGGLYIKVIFDKNEFNLDSFSGSYYFICDSFGEKEPDFTVEYIYGKSLTYPLGSLVFEGSSDDEIVIPYELNVFECQGYVSLFFKIRKNNSFYLAKADIFSSEKKAIVHLDLKDKINRGGFDPFAYPLGTILLNYIFYEKNSIVIHASGVKDGQRDGYVFTAVSGTGKSTMAALWEKQGAKIINDDRLILRPNKEGVIMTNAPMPYYQDINKESLVTAIFLIKQSPHNYIKPVSKVAAITGIMSNCIQFHYDAKMVKQQLQTLMTIENKCKVYELGFKPDVEIVELIKYELG